MKALLAWGLMLWHKYEKLRYLVVGGLTTVLNYAVYAACLWLFAGKYDYIFATTISFIAAVIFAYYTNKHMVFQAKTASKEDALREAGSFLMMRLVSFGFELAAMWLLVDVLHMNKWLAKLPVNIIIVILNYVFSKLFIFRKQKADLPGNGEENPTV